MRISTLLAVFAAALLTACSTTNNGFKKPDLTKVSIGMTREQVVAALGKPDSVASDGVGEYLEYGWDKFMDGNVGSAEWYFVRIKNGSVDSFGRKGDFNTTKDPTQNINVRVQ